MNERITKGVAIASNLCLCQIISSRDKERVAKAIDTAVAEATKPLVAALVSIEEYWNDSPNSSVDAVEEMRFRALQAITAHGGKT